MYRIRPGQLAIRNNGGNTCNILRTVLLLCSLLRRSEGPVIPVDNTHSSEVKTAEQTLGHRAISESSELRLVTDYRVG